MSAELYHYGVMGMKWGKWNEETRKRRLGTGRGNIGSAQRVRAKQERIKKRLQKSSDKGIIRRNTLNDYRRGRIGDLEAKAKHRETKETLKRAKEYNRLSIKEAKSKAKETGKEYKKPELVDLTPMKQQRRKARGERLTRNFLANPIRTTSMGKMARYTDIGNDTTTAMLKTYSKIPIFAVASGVYSVGDLNWGGKGEKKYGV